MAETTGRRVPQETSSTRPLSAPSSYSHNVGRRTIATFVVAAGSLAVSCRVGSQPG